MRKHKNDARRSLLQPTGTVAITFASNVLPDHVDLHGWRFVVNQYIPPVKQCYNCLRYGHLAKYCKNSVNAQFVLKITATKIAKSLQIKRYAYIAKETIYAFLDSVLLRNKR
ncbi:unnamed protein product [Parnassius mnemosyne]|uniref:CCHC-type domain-containing protein n=1 Tax=Parnassius mnemosyne TaxID=213953 RepID=A0AAV1LAK5_9NEOP